MNPVSANPELDVAKLLGLPSEQQELFLLQFVSTLTKHVEGLSAEDCTAQQLYIKKEIFQIINLPTPQPSRVVRNGSVVIHDKQNIFDYSCGLDISRT